MKTMMTVFGALVFSAGAAAGDIYGGFGDSPDLAVWRGAPTDAMGVQPGIGDASSTYRGSGADGNLFKSAPSGKAVDARTLDRVDIYGGFESPDLRTGL